MLYSLVSCAHSTSILEYLSLSNCFRVIALSNTPLSVYLKDHVPQRYPPLLEAVLVDAAPPRCARSHIFCKPELRRRRPSTKTIPQVQRSHAGGGGDGGEGEGDGGSGAGLEKKTASDWSEVVQGARNGLARFASPLASSRWQVRRLRLLVCDGVRVSSTLFGRFCPCLWRSEV